ncbi:hypothetical protein Fcan01_26515 [Folsomia candida]|uniref:Uncharacterized protein n=1 Tax=Folsomia candida TaxID=158441 RepID=A0A226D1U9_FOLCA|nr:hypothetical protein Fcan01_26515 [Folsomia candida]
MCTIKPTFYTSLFIILIVNFARANKPTPVSSLTDLLANLCDCDLQLIHWDDYDTQVSFSGGRLVYTTIFMPDYDAFKISPHYNFVDNQADEFPAMDILRSRVSSCRLSFILLPIRLKSSPHKVRHQTLRSITISTMFHLFYEVVRNKNKYIYMLNKNAFINIATITPKMDSIQNLPFYPFNQPYYYYLSLIIANHRQNLELCFIPVRQLLESYAGRMICLTQIYLKEGNFVSLVENLGLNVQISCTSERQWELKSLAADTTKTLRKSVKQLTINIFAKGNRSCRLSGRLEQLRVSGLNYNRNQELIFPRFGGYQFLTCYVEPYISFYFFLAPFQPELWAGLAISVVTILTVMTTVHHYRSEKEPFSVWLFILATLFEETGRLPRKMEKTTFCRLSLGIWCLMSVILTNGYNGIMILELNAPRKVFHPDNFDHLRCLNQFDDAVKLINKYGWINPDEAEKTVADPHIIIGYQAFWRFNNENLQLLMREPDRVVDLNTTNVSYNCYQLLSAFHSNTGFENLPDFLLLLLKLAFELVDLRDENPQTNISQKMYRDLNLFNSKHSFYPIGFSYLTGTINYSVQERKIEEEVVQCGKTVFVGKSIELKIEYDFLSRKYPKTKFFMSSEAIQTYPSGVVFTSPWKSLALIRLKIALEAGIWGHVEEEELRQRNFNRTPAVSQLGNRTPSNTATLGGSLVTVFILSGSLMLVTVLIFIIECRAEIGFFILSIYRRCMRYQKLKKLAAKAAVKTTVSVVKFDVKS